MCGDGFKSLEVIGEKPFTVTVNVIELLSKLKYLVYKFNLFTLALLLLAMLQTVIKRSSG